MKPVNNACSPSNVRPHVNDNVSRPHGDVMTICIDLMSEATLLGLESGVDLGDDEYIGLIAPEGDLLKPTWNGKTHKKDNGPNNGMASSSSDHVS